MDGFCYSYCYFCCSSSSSYQHTIEYNFQIESALRHHLHSASCLCISENLTNFQCASFHAFALSLGLFSHHGKYAVLLTFDCAFCNTAFIYYLFILFVFAANFRPLFSHTCESHVWTNNHFKYAFTEGLDAHLLLLFIIFDVTSFVIHFRVWNRWCGICIDAIFRFTYSNFNYKLFQSIRIAEVLSNQLQYFDIVENLLFDSTSEQANESSFTWFRTGTFILCISYILLFEWYLLCPTKERATTA